MADNDYIREGIQQAALVTARTALAMVKSAPDHATAAAILEQWIVTLEPPHE